MLKFLALLFCCVFIQPCYAKQLTNIDYKQFPFEVEKHINEIVEDFSLYSQNNGYDIYKITFNECDNDSRMYIVLKNNEFTEVMFVNVTSEAEVITYNKITASLQVLGFSEEQSNKMLKEAIDFDSFFMWNEKELAYISLVRKEITNGYAFYILRT